MKPIFLHISIASCFLLLVGLLPLSGKPNTDLLELLDAKKCGINYENTIQETGLYNHVFWENVYHGAGLAIGDINNDGKPDIFFAGNQVKDELYLNQGDFQFKNISKQLNAPAEHYWSSGVTMADVNADGWLDIYVCKSGPSLNPEERRNLLFINNQDNSFTEKAKQFGLADTGYSLQATFFDMDNDGDLDAYVLNQPPSTLQEKRQNILQQTSCDDFTDNLYRNDNGQFVKITQQAGLQNCAYGLGILATDINNDGWTDLYISNDYLVSDYCYINQKDGTFKDEAKQFFSHESLYAMGVDVADFNNDALLDVFTADMSAADHYRNKANMPSMNRQRFDAIIEAGNNHQYMFNALQMNNGNGSFSEIAQIANVANTDWSWSSLLVDVDSDGFKDLLITNGIKRDVRFVDGLNKLKKALADGTIKLSEILQNTPSQPLKNFAFQNTGGLSFQDQSEEWSFALESFSSGMAYADLDNDGDLDIVINNVDQAPFIFKNKGQNNFLNIKLKGGPGNPFGFGAKASIQTKNGTQVLELSPTRGYLSASQALLHFGLGDQTNVEKLTIDWGNGKQTVLENVKANQELHLSITEATSTTSDASATPNIGLFSKTIARKISSWKHQEQTYDPFKKEVLLPHKGSQLGPALAVGDVNNDGLDDLFVGGAKNQSGTIWTQQTSGEFTPYDEGTFRIDNQFEDVTALFFDANQDGLVDLYVASGSNEFEQHAPALQDRLYLNHGSGFVHDVTALPSMLITTGTVQACDYDQDGDLDLFVGGMMEQHNYPIAAPSYLLENRAGKFVDVTEAQAPMLRKIGMVKDAQWSDIDLDGDQDLMLVGEWMQITCLVNETGQFSLLQSEALEKTAGMWHSIKAFDFDQDGDEDFLIGNLGKNNKFKKGNETGFHLFFDDFDENGVGDIVLGKEKGGALLPVRGRECSSEQMPFIAEKFPSFHEFASASLEDIYSTEKLENAQHFQVNIMESIYLENLGQGAFKVRPLPAEAQISVITDFLVQDFDKDGISDVLVVGNKYETEVETARYDASIGLVLKGKENASFEATSSIKSGFAIRGNMRSAQLIRIQNKPTIVVAINDGQLELRTINP